MADIEETINPADFLPQEEQEPIVLQPLDTRTPLPPHERNKRAFYSSMLENDPEGFKDNYTSTEGELRVSNDSQLYTKHLTSWQAEQSANIEGDINNILLDPTVPTQNKMQVLQQFRNGEFISNDLEDKWIQQAASEEIHDTKADEKSQDIMLETMLDTVQKHRAIEELKADKLAVESGSGYGDLISGIVRDFIPGVLTAENVMIGQAISDALGESYKEHVNSTFRSVAFQGSANQRIGQILDGTLDPDKKLQFVNAIIDANMKFPGTSYNKWSQLQDKLNQGEMGPAEVLIENFIGWADVIGIGRFIMSPIRTLQYLSSFKLISASERKLLDPLLGGPKLDQIGKTPNIADIKARETAEAKQNEVASNPPTGAEIPQPEQISAIATPFKIGKSDIFAHPPMLASKSKVIVDDVGDPKVFYHGTGEDFKDFEITSSLDAIFVSPDPNFAAKYARGDTPNIRPVYVKESNLFNYSDPDHIKKVEEYVIKNNEIKDGKIQYEEKSISGKIFTKEDSLKSVFRELRNTKNLTGNWIELEKPYIQKAIRALGFEGFIVKEHNIDNIAVFKPDRLESAIRSKKPIDASEAAIIQNPVRIEVAPPSDLISIGVQPSVSKVSPLGVTQAASPTKAKDLAVQSILDPAIAKASGAEPGEIIGSFALEKLDDNFLKNNPDIVKDIEKWDKEFNNLYDEVKLDPFLVDTVERTVDKERIYRSFQETQGAYYQASNSTLNESLGLVEGRARFSRTPEFGFNSAEEAIIAERNLKENFIDTETNKYTTNIVEENGQWFVDMNWKKEYDPFSARVFDVEASFMGADVSSFARTHVSKYIMPPTTRLPEWFTKGGYLNSVTALRIEEQFNRFLKEIQNTKFTKELDETLINISENQRYLTEGDVAKLFPHLNEAGRLEIMRKQYQWQRLSEYIWNVTNRVERSRLISEGMQGIWQGDKHLGNARATDQVPSSVGEVWDFEMKTGVRRPTDLKNMQFVKLDSPIREGKKVYDYAIVGGSTKLDILPSHIVPKIEGYVPRMNIESWYIKTHPKSLVVNGNTLSDVNQLREKYTRTIGAAKNKQEAELLTKKLQEEMGDDFVVSFVRERSDVGDAILTDFKVYKEKTDYGKKRGDRLPTIDGFSRLEHPFVAVSKRIRTLSRLDAWRGYDEIAKKNFMKSFAAFLPKGEFPNTIHDLKLPNNATEDMVKSFNEAQRIFEQYTNSKYKLNPSDIVFKTVGHKLADSIEGWLNNMPAERVREIANKGDIFRKGLKSLGTNLFLNLNPAAQWLVQTQVILPFAMMEKGFRNQMHLLPALMISVLGKASHGKPYKELIDEAAATLSLENRAEFEAIADAVYKVGIPQGVDLNMMLHGGLDEIAKPLVQGVGQKAVDVIGQVITKPGKIGKTIGYTPAQLMADMSGFLFAKARWERVNPGKNWNTPQNIRQIAGDAWDIMGSMSSRAGSMPFQDGYLGVLFQFQAIMAKNMFTLFSSKSLKKAPGELVDPKVKLAAANIAAFGIYGVPASAMVYGLWEQFFGDTTDPETLALYQRYRGGLVDLVTNATIDQFFSEPGDRPMDLAISERIGPMPDKVPYVDLGWELFKYMTGHKTDNPRFPFVNASGAVFDAVRDTYNLLAATPKFDTVDAVMAFGAELAEATSGFNNYGKAAAIAELADKKNRFGDHLGLELNFNHAVAQVFGIKSQQEVAIYEMMNNKEEREQYINERVTKLSQDMEKLKDKLGTPEFDEYVRRVKVLNAGTKKEDQEEIIRRFLQRDRKNWLTKKQSMMKYFIEHHKGQEDAALKQMEATFMNGTPQEQEFIKMLNRNLEGLNINE